MKCEKLRILLDTTFAENRTPQQMKEVNQHAQQCQVCAESLSKEVSLDKQLGEIPSIAANGKIMRVVMTHIMHETLTPAEFKSESHDTKTCLFLLVLSLSIVGLAYFGLLSDSQVYRRLWTIQLQPRDILNRLLCQSLTVTMLFGLGVSFAAAVILLPQRSSLRASTKT